MTNNEIPSTQPKNRKDESIQRRSSTLLNEKTSFTVTEAYKAARTNILFVLGASKGCKKIIVTSANPGEGKTTTAINLAIAFAQTDAKVLIIDADLRKPRMYRHFKLERKDGLSDILCDMIDFESAIHHIDEYGIDCITSGQIPPNPTELLSSEAMGNLLDKLSEMYDYIFIDTPPITVVTEAAVMTKFVNGVIMVVRQNYTIHESLAKARANLLFADAKILGYILNDISAAHYGYGRYYNRGYSSYSFDYDYGYSDDSYNYKYGYSNRYAYRYGRKKYGYYKHTEKPHSEYVSHSEQDEENQAENVQAQEYIGKKKSFLKRLLRK